MIGCGAASRADDFLFATAAEAGISPARDHITDFQHGLDNIDLHLFMAGGSFIGAAAYGGIAKPLRYEAVSGTLIGDVNGDGWPTSRSHLLANPPSQPLISFLTPCPIRPISAEPPPLPADLI